MQDGDSRDPNEIAVFALIEQGLSALEIAHEPQATQRLTALVLLLEKWASRINLTGHRDALSITTRLLLDAAALSAALPELEEAERVADLGTGAGFPGLPIAILHPETEVFLVDSRLKRNHFQREVCRRLGLKNVRPILGRAEQVEIHPSDVVIAQAMTRPEKALALMIPWTRPGGLVILPASEGTSQPCLPSQLELIVGRSYVVPHTRIHRRVWVARTGCP